MLTSHQARADKPRSCRLLAPRLQPKYLGGSGETTAKVSLGAGVAAKEWPEWVEMIHRVGFFADILLLGLTQVLFQIHLTTWGCLLVPAFRGLLTPVPGCP